MKVYIIYATTEGHTGKVVDFVSNLLSERGIEVSSHDTAGKQERSGISEFDKVIVAGSVHSGRHQEALEMFVFANKDELNALPTLFLSVSMAAAFDDSISDAERYVSEFKDSTKWLPSQYLLVAGAIDHTDYGYFEEAALQYGDLADHAFAEMKEDKVFTDWDALSNKVNRFIDE
ncbi:MAG: flavodoxin domain-containing protein [Rhizobiaceae bacterium]